MMVQVKGKGRGSASSCSAGGIQHPREQSPGESKGHCTQATPDAGTARARTLPHHQLTPPALCRGLSPPQKKHGTSATTHSSYGVLPRALHSTGAAGGKQGLYCKKNLCTPKARKSNNVDKFIDAHISHPVLFSTLRS